MAEVQEGWTDDMTIHVCPPRTLEELVEFVLQAEIRKVPSDETVGTLATRFGLSVEDAGLAWDRTLGGLVRAATGIPANCPARGKDPVAWISYHRCLREPAIIAAIRPQFFSGQS
jgi:hypothetical protein